MIFLFQSLNIESRCRNICAKWECWISGNKFIKKAKLKYFSGVIYLWLKLRLMNRFKVDQYHTWLQIYPH